MSRNSDQLERIQILVPGEQRQRMRQLAAQSKCSVSELYRRAADAYSLGTEGEIDNAELEVLVEALETGLARAGSAVERAEREVRATLDFYESRRQARATRG